MPEIEISNNSEQEYNNSIYLKILDSTSSLNKNEPAIILKYMGYHYRIKSDTLIDQLNEIRNKLGISFRTIELTDKWYKDSMLPMLIKYKNEFKAVLPNFKGSCFFVDNNKKIKITENNADLFDNKGICFYRGFNDGVIDKRTLFSYMLSCVRKSDYLIVIIAILFSTLFSLMYVQIQRYIFQNLIPSGSIGYIMPVTAYLFGLIINMFIVNVFKGIISANIQLEISANLQSALISRLLKIKPMFFSESRSGSLSQNITRLSDVSDIFSLESISSLLSYMVLFIYIAATFIYAKMFTVYVIAFFFIIQALEIYNSILYEQYISKFYTNSNEMTGYIYELFSGMENVKLNNADETMFSRWSDYYTETILSYKKPFFLKYYYTFKMLIVSVFTLLIYIEGISNRISAANFISFTTLFGMIVSSSLGISNVFESIVKFKTSFDRIKDFLYAETDETSVKAELKGIKKGIEFSNVSYKYPNSKNDIFSGISFYLPMGKKIGIVGKSGCGKSTLLKLLLGFESPYEGHIFIDDMDINEINLRSYRKKLGVVLQNTKLIPADIYSNITLTKPNASNEEVMEVLEAVGLKEDIIQLPMGLSTFVSEDNMSISAGQKQRILIARAIISKPSLLILDEATSALDNILQSVVTKHIEKTNTTALIVAHRLSTIKQCDFIMFLNDGKIEEQGNYKELIEKKGKFYELVKNQL